MEISAVVMEISEFERGFRKGSEIVDNFKHVTQSCACLSLNTGWNIALGVQLLSTGRSAFETHEVQSVAPSPVILCRQGGGGPKQLNNILGAVRYMTCRAGEQCSSQHA